MEVLKTIRTFLISTAFLQSAFAFSPGSERFAQFSSGAPAHGILVGMARDPNITSNLMFSDVDFVSGIAYGPHAEGVGEQYLAASVMNLGGNFTMAAAKTDPRSPGFIMNNMDKMLTNPQFEMEFGEGLKASEMSVAQAGENAARYLTPEIITPEVGTYQTADNQQSFESAYDNVMLGRAEEALFEGDQLAATNFFDRKLEDYKNKDNKQSTASNFQKEGMLRSVKTAETFRNFFQMKAEMTQANLDQMPTKESLVQNCHKNTRENENQHGIFHRAMPAPLMSFYKLQPPVYDFDFCDSYVHSEESFLVRNEPVQEQLKKLVSDSSDMANGLDEVAQELQGRDLGVEQIADILSKSEAWKTLQGRAAAFKECKKTDCLSTAEKTLGGFVNFPGSDRRRAPYRKQFRGLLKQIRDSKSMPGAESELLAAIQKKMNQKKKKAKQAQRRTVAKDGFTLQSGEEPERAPASYTQIGAVYRGKKYPRGGGYFRGEDGVLRGPSGKPVQGYEGRKGDSLWDIISNRYMKKFKNEL